MAEPRDDHSDERQAKPSPPSEKGPLLTRRKLLVGAALGGGLIAGVRPRDHYLNLRLARARQLLLETDHDILGIGLACGFASASSFSRTSPTCLGCSRRTSASTARSVRG